MKEEIVEEELVRFPDPHHVLLSQSGNMTREEPLLEMVTQVGQVDKQIDQGGGI